MKKIMENIINWFFDGQGQVVLGILIMGISGFLFIAGVLLTLRGLGFFKM